MRTDRRRVIAALLTSLVILAAFPVQVAAEDQPPTLPLDDDLTHLADRILQYEKELWILHCYEEIAPGRKAGLGLATIDEQRLLWEVRRGDGRRVSWGEVLEAAGEAGRARRWRLNTTAGLVALASGAIATVAFGVLDELPKARVGAAIGVGGAVYSLLAGRLDQPSQQQMRRAIENHNSKLRQELTLSHDQALAIERAVAEHQNGLLWFGPRGRLLPLSDLPAEETGKDRR